MTKLSEKKGGGLIYNPPMMLFDGSTGYYNKSSMTASGNKVTAVLRFAITSFTGGGAMRLAAGISSTRSRFNIGVFASDHAVTAIAGKVAVWTVNSSGTNICQLISPGGYLDGNPHVLFYSFDADAGTAIFRIDQTDADDTGNASRVAPTTGTLDTTAASFSVALGADHVGSSKTTGNLGFFGHREAYLTNYSDFIDQFGNPKQTDFSGWLFGHFAGKMDENEGTAGAMTKNGTITLADSGVCPMIGLPTVGDAVAADIASGKIAWVNGVEIVGTAV